MFITVSVWGWYRWRQTRVTGGAHAQGTAVIPQWASGWERAGLIAVMAAGTVGLTPVFRAMGSYEPVWSDTWIFTGSLLATYGMARGWVEFWLIWVAVDLVGVPLLWGAGYYATSLMYVFYGCFTLVGFLCGGVPATGKHSVPVCKRSSRILRSRWRRVNNGFGNAHSSE